MANKEWASLLAGLALAVAGLTAFALADRDPATPAGSTVTTPAASAAGQAPAANTPMLATTTTSAGLSDPVARALAQTGALREIDPAALGIPPEIARVLAAHGVILTVASGRDAVAVPAADGGAK